VRCGSVNGVVLFLLSAVAGAAAGGPAAPAVPSLGVVREVVLEDFTDVVTHGDLGLDDFSGNTSALNKDGRSYGAGRLVRSVGGTYVLRFAWNFGVDRDEDAFTGLFYSLFGLTDTLTTFDGVKLEKLAFPEHSLDLDRVDGALAEPGGPRSFTAACASVTYRGVQPLTLRMELADVHGGARFARFRLSGSSKRQVLCWRFRDQGQYRVRGDRDLDLHQAKVLSFVIERRHVTEGVVNPERGSVDLARIWFVPSRPEREPQGERALLDLVERRAAQFFVDWASGASGSRGIPQDRSTFPDLLTVGGIGFALPAYIICAERGWISRSEAAARVLSVLRVLAQDGAFGPERVGRIGYLGWYYHFLGVDGRRKLNFDHAATRADESLNTVELSTIDTGLALMGVLAAQSYFARADAREAEIRALAQKIYDRVDWPFMLEPRSRQFYLGWKPDERRAAEPAFAIPDRAGTGAYSGTPGHPATLDFNTDEALIVTLLAAGSRAHPVPRAVLCAWKRARDMTGLVRTYPGSLFTYQFLRAFLDTRPGKLILRCPGEKPINWYRNSRKAILATIAYVERNPRRFQTYGPDAWGISAAEGSYDTYHAYGVPPVALNPRPEQDGTVAYYAMVNAATFGADLQKRVIRAVRRAWRRGHWHYRFGLPDAFNDQIAQAGLRRDPNPLRRNGAWVQRALFAINEGPMLLHLENLRSGLIWRLIACNPNIKRALGRLKA
jgi:hypothetical protein